ncbi:hypothetical protein [Pedobacter sp. L105]|uniref:hypothetical protein n=1 Tax=Pedobacter sp. L105 TaxID=1641871 RepID=UPI00131A9C89|nr:hypothetical protein [Pedobacter sp. L105]
MYRINITSLRQNDPRLKIIGVDPERKDVKLYLSRLHKTILQEGLIEKIKDSGIFTITTWQKEYDKLKKNNQYESGGFLILDATYPVVEIKLGNKYRSFNLGLHGNGTVNDQYTNQVKKIDDLIKFLRD